MLRVGALVLLVGVVVSAAGQGPVAAPETGAAYVPTMVFDVASVRESKPDVGESGWAADFPGTPVR